MNRKYYVAIAFLTTVLLNCQNAHEKTDTNEEINVYSDIICEIIDTAFYFRELEKHSSETAVFFLFDSLTSLNNGNGDISCDKMQLDKKHFIVTDIKGINKYKFVRATKYPKDSLIGTTMQERIQDGLKLERGEWFTNKWITLSRVCFDNKRTKGYLHYRIWCGNLCSESASLEIAKEDHKWRVIQKKRGAIS